MKRTLHVAVTLCAALTLLLISAGDADAKRKKKGTLQLISEPIGAVIFVNGQNIGQTNWTKRVPVGNYEITFKKSGWKDLVKSVEVTPEGGVLKVEMEPEGEYPDGPVSPAAQEAIRMVITQNRREAMRCYEQHLPDDSKLAGSLLMAFTIDTEGKTKEVFVGESNLPKEDESAQKLEKCLIELFSSLRFKPQGKDVPVRFPLKVEPRVEEAPKAEAATADEKKKSK